MGLIDQMKYAKILYLADVLEDIQNEMNRDYRCHSYAESIGGIAKDLRETVADTTPPGEMKCDKFEMKRFEYSHRIFVLDVPPGEMKSYDFHTRRFVEDNLLNYIQRNNLVHISKHEDDSNGTVTFTASLIVGIEKQPYVPQEQPLTPVDGLAKILDEIDKNTNL